MTDRGTTLLDGRVKRIEKILGHALSTPVSPPSEPLSSEERSYLREAAEELYWNELEWERLTNEEQLDQDFLTELAFPGFLAFVRGLLLEEAMPDSLADARPSPEVVDDLLVFLASRVVELDEDVSGLEGEERDQREAELKLTSRLLDLVLYYRHGLALEEVDRVEAVLAGG
jgi:hypothetical protein